MQPKATQLMGMFEHFPPNAVCTVTCPMLLFLASLKNNRVLVPVFLYIVQWDKLIGGHIVALALDVMIVKYGMEMGKKF